MPARHLPPRPNLRQLRHQAKDLLRAFHRGDHSAMGWSQLVLACRIIEATSRDDFDAVRELVEAHPEVVRQVASDHDAGWQSTMASAADLGLRRVIVRLRDLGVRGIKAAVAKPELRQWLDALRLLGRIGARPPEDAPGRDNFVPARAARRPKWRSDFREYHPERVDSAMTFHDAGVDQRSPYRFGRLTGLARTRRYRSCGAAVFTGRDTDSFDIANLDGRPAPAPLSPEA